MYYEVSEIDESWMWREAKEDGNVINHGPACATPEEAAKSLFEYLAQDELEREGWKKNERGDYQKGMLRVYHMPDGWYIRSEPCIPFDSAKDALSAIKQAASC